MSPELQEKLFHASLITSSVGLITVMCSIFTFMMLRLSLYEVKVWGTALWVGIVMFGGGFIAAFYLYQA